MGQIVSVFPAQPALRQTLTLGDEQFSLRLTWRDRTYAWYADLWAADGTPIWLGQRVSAGWALGFGLEPEGKPDGVFLVRGPDEYDRMDLGNTLQLVFYPTDELPEAEVSDDDLVVTVP